MLFFEIDTCQTVELAKKYISPTTENSDILRKACETHLNAFNKGHTYKNIMPQDALFTKENVKDIQSFINCVYFGKETFIRLPIFVQKLLSQCIFFQYVTESNLSNFYENTNKAIQKQLLKDKTFILDNLCKELIVFFKEKQKFSAEKINELELKLKTHFIENNTQQVLLSKINDLVTEIEKA